MSYRCLKNDIPSEVCTCGETVCDIMNISISKYVT